MLLLCKYLLVKRVFGEYFLYSLDKPCSSSAQLIESSDDTDIDIYWFDLTQSISEHRIQYSPYRKIVFKFTKSKLFCFQQYVNCK